MGEKTGITLRWPIKGFNERLGLNDQLPLTTPSARNVRPDGNIEGRTRGGSRPGLIKAYHQGLGAVAEGVHSSDSGPTAGLTTITASTTSRTGTLASITSPAVKNLTTLVSAGTEFKAVAINPTSPPSSVGCMFHFDATGNEYQIAEFVSTSTIKVVGDATGEGETDTFVVAPFNSDMVGHSITFSTTGNVFRISSVTSQTVLVVFGDASAESGNFVAGHNQILMLSQVNAALTPGTIIWSDSFPLVNQNGTFSANGPWREFGAGYSESLDPLRINPTRGAFATTIGRQADMLRDRFDPILELGSSYEITLFGQRGTTNEDHYVRIYAAMGGIDPDPTANGFIIEYHWDQSEFVYRVNITQYISSTPVLHPGADFPGTGLSGLFLKVKIYGDRKQVDAFYNGDLVATKTFSSAATDGISRIGFGLEDTAGNPDFAKWHIRRIDVEYTPRNVVPNITRQQLVSSANGRLWRTTAEDTLTRLSTLLRLPTDRSFMAASHNQKLYIADHGTALASGTDGAMATTNKLTAPSISDWTVLGINVNDHVVVITDELVDVVPGVYKIVGGGIASSGLTLANRSASTAVGSSGGCTYRVERAVKVFDPAAGTLAIAVETDGPDGLGFPQGCKLIEMFQDRLFLGAPENNPHQWFASRKAGSAATDRVDEWNFFDDAGDPSFAASYSSGDVGSLGGDLTAMFAASADYLIYSTKTSIWVLRGDPRAGVYGNLSRQIGIIDKKAWCITPTGTVLFLSEDGLYAIPPSIDGSPVSLSRKLMPEQLININVEQNEVLLEYDVRFTGVHIYLTAKSSFQSSGHWWFDMELESFWPVEIPTNLEPRSIISYSAPLSQRGGTLLGCRDGYIRHYVAQATSDDDATAITSHIVFGPIPLGGDPFHAGIVTELFSALAVDSGNVTWKLFVADTAEECKNLAIDDTVTADATGTWTGSDVLSYKSRPRRRGGFFCLRLNNSSTDRAWAIEMIQVATKKAGKLRK